MKNEEYLGISIGEVAYPERLNNIQDPPANLRYLGDLSLLDLPCIAVVGSRKATDYGKWAAYKLSRRLSECGVVVVSGMAEGVDSFAHKGALDGPTPTVAVMGNGLDICFPKSNFALRRRIVESGLIISEYKEGTRGAKYTFPARNRIISGLCAATVIVEAGLSSGSLITAGHAESQGREVFAIPGNINRKQSVGCNMLIRDGVRPLVFFDDVLDCLNLSRRVAVSSPDERAEILGEDEAIVLACALKNGELTIDDAAALTGLRVASVTSVVTLLEMKGFISMNHGRIMPLNT